MALPTLTISYSHSQIVLDWTPPTVTLSRLPRSQVHGQRCLMVKCSSKSACRDIALFSGRPGRSEKQPAWRPRAEPNEVSEAVVAAAEPGAAMNKI